MHKAVAIIPARFNSTRFPGKPLATLKGKIIIQHVYEKVITAGTIDTVLVATDDKRIFDAVTTFGGKAVMTSSNHESGTDRIAEAARNIKCDFVINVQGDEPFIRPEMIDDVVSLLYNDAKASISTLSKRITDLKEILSPSVVKVVTDNEGFALYFSRSPIPHYRDKWKIQIKDHRTENTDNPPSPPRNDPSGSILGIESYRRTEIPTFRKGGMGGFVFELRIPNAELKNFYCYKHIGIYGFRRDALINFTEMSQSKIEQIEKLEQLRALSSGMKIKVKETQYDTFGIDTVEDLKRAEEILH